MDKERGYGEDQAFMARTHNEAPALPNRKAEDAATDAWDRQKRRSYPPAPAQSAAALPSANRIREARPGGTSV